MKKPNDDFDLAATQHEAEIFGHYLIQRQPTETYVARYTQAIQTSRGELSTLDEKLLAFSRQHPRMLGFIDAGLAFSRPTAELRRRIYVLFALLEASPEYCKYFLPKKRSPFYVLYVLFVGLRAGCKAIIGLAMVKAIG